MTSDVSRRTLLTTGIAVGALPTLSVVAGGCGNDAGPAAGMEARDELRVGVQGLPSTLDANASVSNVGIQVYHNVFDTLIMRDTQSEEIAFKPGLAEDWNRLDDLTWEFTIRDAVTFHDGSPMTADDVAYSLNRVIQEEDPSYATAHAYLLANFTTFEAVDEKTIRVETVEPEPLLEHLLSDPNAGISSRAHAEEVGLERAGNQPVATGPYRVTEFTPDVRIILEAVEDHWSGESAPYTKVTYVSIPEIASRVTALANDEVDMITNIPPDQEQLLDGDDRTKLVGSVMQLYHVYRFNMENPKTDDPNLRAALDYAIDREVLAESIWDGKATPATSYQFDTYGEELQFPDRQDISYDPDLARELLAASDYDGETIRIFNTTDYYTYADLAAQAIVDMWSDIGVTGQLVQVDSVSDSDNEELEIRSWSNPLYYNDPMGVIERHWSPTGEAVNLGHFVASDDYTEAFHTARYGLDESDRAAALEQIFEYYREQTPFIYLYMPHESLAMRANINYTEPRHLRPYQLSFRDGDISETTT